MPRILHQLPIYRTRKPATLPGGGLVAILPYQIVLWVSVTPMWQRMLDANTPRFPAVLDPGFNHNFVIQETQFLPWTGLQREHFRVVDHLQIYGQQIPLYPANVWLHPNQSGERDLFVDRPPFCLHLDTGMGICPPTLAKPRLPLLGLRALFSANLELTLDCRSGYLSLRTPRRFWFFG